MGTDTPGPMQCSGKCGHVQTHAPRLWWLWGRHRRGAGKALRVFENSEDLATEEGEGPAKQKKGPGVRSSLAGEVPSPWKLSLAGRCVQGEVRMLNGPPKPFRMGVTEGFYERSDRVQICILAKLLWQ